MTRTLLLLTTILAIAAPAAAQSPQDLEKAKKEFIAGKKAFDGGDFPEAASHFKTSYNLSKKPTLLYNVALANESGGQDDIALFYYRKFLTDADPADAQRPDAEQRVKAIEKKLGLGTQTPTNNNTGNTGNTGGNNTTQTPTNPPPEQHKEPTKLKPSGTYQPTEFQHQVIDTAPPKKPLDVTAFVPEDSGWKVTLYYRTAGEGKFQSKEMRWRYKELVARIPATKMLGNSVQYYIEVKDSQAADPAAAVVTRSGKSTSPLLVTLEAGAAERFYPDWNDETGTTQTAAEVKANDEDEDPLNKGKKKVVAVRDPESIDPVVTPVGPGNGFRDVGSSKFKYMKWGATGAAGVMAGLSVLFYLQAGKQATALEEDSLMCGAPPCRTFDPYDKDLQDAGKRYQTLSTVTLVVGVGAAAIAGYYWYKELTAKKRGEVKVSGKNAAAPEASSWIIAPSVGDGFAGAAAAARF